jgi:hypothetical protein
VRGSLLHGGYGVCRDFADLDDQRDALETDRQGLGMPREPGDDVTPALS